MANIFSNFVKSEQNRRRRGVGFLVYHVWWTWLDGRDELLYRVADVGMPALLCLEFRYWRTLAEQYPGVTSIIMDPLGSIMEPVEGYSWIQSIQFMERRAAELMDLPRSDMAG